MELKRSIDYFTFLKYGIEVRRHDGNRLRFAAATHRVTSIC